MSRIVKYLFTALVMSMMLSGCSSPTDDDDKGFNIIGTWYNIEHSDDSKYDIIFFENGTYYTQHQYGGELYGSYSFLKNEKKGFIYFIYYYSSAYMSSSIMYFWIEDTTLILESSVGDIRFKKR